MQLGHLRLDIFLTFSYGFRVFDAHFLITVFLTKNVYQRLWMLYVCFMIILQILYNSFSLCLSAKWQNNFYHHISVFFARTLSVTFMPKFCSFNLVFISRIFTWRLCGRISSYVLLLRFSMTYKHVQKNCAKILC